jgi:hypothetical protein
MLMHYVPCNVLGIMLSARAGGCVGQGGAMRILYMDLPTEGVFIIG